MRIRKLSTVCLMITGIVISGVLKADSPPFADDSVKSWTSGHTIPVLETGDWHSTYFDFYFGHWIEAWPHDPGDCTISADTGITKLFEVQTWEALGDDPYAPADYDCIRSSHFGSIFYVVYAKTPLSRLGQGGPKLVFIAARSESLVLLDELKDTWPPSRIRSMSYLEEDFQGVSDSAGAWNAAIDAISVSAGVTPLVFVDSLEDICDYAGIVSDSLRWQEIHENPVAQRWLQSFRIVHLDDLFVAIGRTRHPSMKCTERAEKYRDLIKERRIHYSGEEWIVEVSTWTPAGGLLTTWRVVLGNESITINALDVGLGVGYRFMTM